MVLETPDKYKNLVNPIFLYSHDDNIDKIDQEDCREIYDMIMTNKFNLVNIYYKYNNFNIFEKINIYRYEDSRKRIRDKFDYLFVNIEFYLGILEHIMTHKYIIKYPQYMPLKYLKDYVFDYFLKKEIEKYELFNQ